VRQRARRAADRLRVRFEVLEGVALWALSHVSSVWPAIAIAAILWLTWSTLRQVHIHEVRDALEALDARWVWAAGAFTALNVAVMGLYDVVAFSHTRSPTWQRWRYGAIAFAWSNFLTLGPMAGPAIRFWLYAPAIDRSADLQGGVVATAVAFTAGLGGWTGAVVVAARIHAGLASTAVIALAATLLMVIAASWIARRVSDLADSGFAAHPIAMALVGWLDWMLAAAAFLCAVRAGLGSGLHQSSLPPFFFGQVVGLASFAPGGFGSADAYWIARLPAPAAAKPCASRPGSSPSPPPGPRAS